MILIKRRKIYGKRTLSDSFKNINIVICPHNKENYINVNIANQLSIVNFTNCEKKLKEIYNISSNEGLLFYKIDYNASIDASLNNKTWREKFKHYK